jgi:hypothetical protein
MWFDKNERNVTRRTGKEGREKRYIGKENIS